eukprot:01576_5
MAITESLTVMTCSTLLCRKAHLAKDRHSGFLCSFEVALSSCFGPSFCLASSFSFVRSFVCLGSWTRSVCM